MLRLTARGYAEQPEAGAGGMNTTEPTSADVCQVAREDLRLDDECRRCWIKCRF